MPPPVTIAALDPARQDEVAKLFHAVWHETQGPLQDARIARFRDLDFFRNRVAERAGRTLIATVDGECAGFAAWTGGHLNSLFVARAFRGQGIGALLCEAAERRMRRAGARRLWLNCIAGNDAARAFYARHGWRIERRDELVSETPEGVCRVTAWKMVKP